MQILLRPVEIPYLGICLGVSNIAAEYGRVHGALSLSVVTKTTTRADFTNWLYAYLNGVYLNLKQLLNTNFYYWLLLGGLQEGPAVNFLLRMKIAFGVIPFNFFFFWMDWVFAPCLQFLFPLVTAVGVPCNLDNQNKQLLGKTWIESAVAQVIAIVSQGWYFCSLCSWDTSVQ